MINTTFFFNGRGNINVSPILVFINHTEAFRLGDTRVSESEVGLEFHLADWEISLKIFWMTVVSQFWDKFGIKLFYAPKKKPKKQIPKNSIQRLPCYLSKLCLLRPLMTNTSGTYCHVWVDLLWQTNIMPMPPGAGLGIIIIYSAESRYCLGFGLQ